MNDCTNADAMNKALVRARWGECINGRDLGRREALIAADFVGAGG